MPLQKPPSIWGKMFSSMVWHPWFLKLWQAVVDLQNAPAPVTTIRTTYTSGSGTHTFNADAKYYDVDIMAGGASGAINAASANFGGGGGCGAKVSARRRPIPGGGTATYNVGAGGVAATCSAAADVAGNAGASSDFDGITAGGAPATPTGGAGGPGGSILYYQAANTGGAGNGDTGAGAGSAGNDAQNESSNGPGGARGNSATGQSGATPGYSRFYTAGFNNSGAAGWDGLGGDRQVTANVNGNNGIGTSSGGSGARRTAGTVTSGAGVDGKIIVTEYL